VVKLLADIIYAVWRQVHRTIL